MKLAFIAVVVGVVNCLFLFICERIAAFVGGVPRVIQD